MLETARLPLETVRRYAYLNVLASFLVWGFALAGISMMMPVMYDSIAKDTGWTLGQTTTFMVVKSLVSALTGLLVGSMFIKFGLKRVYIISLAAIGISTSMLYFAHSLPVYYAAAALSGFFSINCNIAFQVTLARWFSARLGSFTGLALLGGAVAGAIIPLTTTYMVQHYGWRLTSGVAGLLVLVVLTTLVGLLAHESPEKYGYTADDIDPPKDGAVKTPVGGPAPGEEFSEMLRSPRFYVLLGAVFCSGAFSNGINEHTALFLAHHADLSKYMAALGFTLVMVISAFGKIAFGWILDRISTRGVALCWALCAVAVALAFPVAGPVTFLTFTLFRGLAQGGVVVQQPILARHMFGIRPVAQTIAFLMAAFHLGAATGIGLIGLGYDLTGGYTVPFVGVIITALAASTVALTFKPKYWAKYKGA
ncbi:MULTISPECIES: MFS transporter [unclassified Novosphingobium]|uniref:MFS transporter n=1 Tax=unclassified Novosphingobium TaxID=2644732 RepID=UPI001359E28E|nr:MULTISPECIES: MFS transporter [unclassified Novosphingobium]